MAKLIYFFGNGKAEGKGGMKALLGGKGAALAEMTHAGIEVPPGFTITTEVCIAFYKNRRKAPPGLDAEMRKHLKKLEKSVGKYISLQNMENICGMLCFQQGKNSILLLLGLNHKEF